MKHRPKIYDCFMFFNELDILEIRLAELYDVVDYFVLVEAPFTHSGKQKPLYYSENKERYKKWNDKIIHVVCPWPKRRILDRFFEKIEDKFRSKQVSKVYAKLKLGRWKLEKYQRDCMRLAMNNAKKEDIIFVSDADEITKKEEITKIAKVLENNPDKTLRLRQKMFYYFLNGFSQEKWEQAKACKYGAIGKDFRCFDDIRHLRPIYRWLTIFNFNPVRDGEILFLQGGWHFSYIGGVDYIISKIENITHFENDKKELKNKEYILKKIIKGENLFPGQPSVKYINLDSSFPKYLLKNKNKFKRLIMQVK